MLAKALRFHGHGAVRNIYRKGRAVHGKIGSLHVYVNEQRPKLRLAVVVSKKLHKSAVKRNRLRRRIYEVVRLRLADLKPAEMVLTVRDEHSFDLSPAELTKAIEDLMKKAQLLL